MNIRVEQIAFNHCILVVDDDLLLNELFCQFLQEKGFLTRGETSLSDAISSIESGKPVDLILLDYQLGDGTGLEFLERLSRANIENVPPVIMVSTHEDPDFLEKCFSSGVADYVIKPVNLSLLALKVSSLIRSVELQRLISLQNFELARFKQDAEREEAVAKFTYEYLLRQNNQKIQGVNIWLKPSSSFSGDIAIAKVSPGGDLYFLLADATGHGLSAAITVMPVVSIFDTMVAKGFDIQPIVIEMNRKLERDTPHDRFVAAVVIHIQKNEHKIHVWNGGMPPAYWISKGEVIHKFKSQHMALGILEDNSFDANVETLAISDSGYFFACSDGLLEQENAEGECFSQERLLNVIRSDPSDLLDVLGVTLFEHAQTESYRDDVSFCVIRPDGLPCYANTASLNATEGSIKEDFSSFSWQVRMSGKKLAHCELSPLCNKFLQSVGMDQKSCQIIFLVVTEMVSNALDHGVLRLDSGLKEEPEGFTRYFQEREERLAKLTNADAIELSLRLELSNAGGPQLVVTVEDTGDGFDFFGKASGGDDLLSGRGLKLIKSLAQSVEIFPPGNRIQVVISTH